MLAVANYTLPDRLDPNGTGQLATEAAYDPTSLLPTSVAVLGQTLYDPIDQTNGTAAYTSYDDYGRVTYTLAPSQVANQALGAQTNYSYTYTPWAWTVTSTTSNTGGGNHWTTTTQDGLGRTVKVQTGINTSTVVSEVDTTYAPCACGPVGKTSWQSQPFLPPNGSPPGTTFSYDALGRTTNVLLADGASHTQYSYQGNVTTVTDPAGKWKQYFTDAFGNLVTVIEPDPQYNPAAPNPPPAYPVTSAPLHTLLTSYTYDSVNHLTVVTMPRSSGTQTRTFTYTPTTYPNVNLQALWLTAATNPENGETDYAYNADGSMASKTDANGHTESYTYDTYGRLTGIPDRKQVFYYDTCPANDIFCTNASGQLVESRFYSGAGEGLGPNQLSFQYNYTYTPAGKVTGKALMVMSANHTNPGTLNAYGSLTATYNYDNQGALTSMVYPAGIAWGVSATQTMNYTLDAMERPTGLADSWSDQRTPKTYASGVTYTAANQTTFGGRAYNNLLQLTQVGDITYNYSATQNNGQITSTSDATTGETITYQYDALKRLASASSNQNWGETYSYDGFGNLLQMQPSGSAGAPALSVSVNAATNRITPSGVSYDNNGNVLTGFGGVGLTYDWANRVTQVQVSGSNTYYGYDSANLRMYARAADGTEKIYFYGIDGRKLVTYTGTIINQSGYRVQLTKQSENVYFTGILVTAEGADVTVDRLGSVKSRGGTRRYYPYGVEYAASGNDTEKYGTYTRDSVSGLDYAVNRYYSSIWGRFLSADPDSGSIDLRNPGTWNRYAYVIDDAVNGSDESGLGGPCDPYNGNTYEGSAGGYRCPAFVGAGPAPSLSDLFGSAAPGSSLSGAQSPSSLVGTDVSSDLQAGEMNYLVQSVLPGLLGFENPSIQSIVWPDGSTSANISYLPSPVEILSALSIVGSLRPADYSQVVLTLGIPVTADILQLGFSITRGSNGSLWYGPVLGLSTPSLGSLSATNGWLLQKDGPSSAEINAWLSGFSVAEQYAFWIALGTQYSKGARDWQYSVEGGVGTPGASASVGWNYCANQAACKP